MKFDTGVGGSVAAQIGLALKKLSHETQVLCVTHDHRLQLLQINIF